MSNRSVLHPHCLLVLLRGLSRRLLTACLGIALAMTAPLASAAQDSKGTDFWLMFNANLGTPALSLFITGDIATNGVVSIPGLGFSSPFSVTPGAVTTVALPSTAQVSEVDTVVNRGIRVVSNAEVTVYGLNRIQATTDAFLGLPTDILGTDYINLGYRNSNIVNATQFGIVATQAATTVTITPTVVSGARAAGVPYTVTLNQGEAYQLRSTAVGPADLSGTLISSNKPIAVFGSHQCANIPAGVTFCDHLVEQLPPTTTWGRSFVTMPLATRLRGDTFRILASTNATEVSINGAVVATINRGQFHEQIVTGPARITATRPVLVAQYSNGSTFDGVTSDPFMMLIPPFEQFLAGYTVTTPATGFSTNFINVVVPNAAVGGVTLDGVAIPAAQFTPIAGTSFSGSQRSVGLGTHTLAGTLPFGAFMYGFASFDSYGYPGGYSVAQVAVVTTIALAPKTATNPVNTQHCVTATLRDQNSAPVSGVRVDFAVTGVNPNTGFANAGTNGVAQFCYSGTNPGTDSIVGSVGTLSDSAAKTWTAAARLTCDADASGQINSLDIALINAARNTVPGPNDVRDANADGRINILDARRCALLCTKPNCAI